MCMLGAHARAAQCVRVCVHVLTNLHVRACVRAFVRVCVRAFVRVCAHVCVSVRVCV